MRWNNNKLPKDGKNNRRRTDKHLGEMVKRSEIHLKEYEDIFIAHYFWRKSMDTGQNNMLHVACTWFHACYQMLNIVL